MKAKRVLGIVMSLIMALTMTVTVPTTVFGSEEDQVTDTEEQGITGTEQENGDQGDSDAPEVEKLNQIITINNEDIPEVMAYHETFELDAQAEGALSYVSSDNTVLSLDDEGIIKAEGLGTATVTVSAGETDNYKATDEDGAFKVTIEVVKAEQEVILDEDIEGELLDNDNTVALEKGKGKTRELKAKAISMTTAEATGCEINYYIDSPDNKVAINDEGVLTAEDDDGIKEATVTMIAAAESNYNQSALRKIRVIVVDELDGIAPASVFDEIGTEGFFARLITVIRTLTHGEWSKYQEATNELIGGIENLSDKIINGEIEVVSGYKFVKKEQTISVEQNELTVALGKTEKIKASAETAVTFTPSDETVLSVDDEGVITPITVGSAVVTITADADSKYKAADPVEVNVSVKQRHSISLETESFKKLTTEGPFPVGASLAEGDEASLTYKSSDESVVTIDEEGMATVKGPGKAQITITARESDKYVESSETVDVTVIEAVQTIKVPSTNIGKRIGEAAFSLGATFEGDPDNKLIYASSNSKVAKVDATGKVTMLTPGTAKITITAPKTDLYTKATKEVTVTVKSLAKPTLTVKAIGKKKIKLTWSTSTGASTYQVYTYVNKKTTTMKGKAVKGNSKQRTITNNKLKKKKTYKYKVRAVVKVNGKTYYSPWSAVKKAKCK